MELKEAIKVFKEFKGTSLATKLVKLEQLKKPSNSYGEVFKAAQLVKKEAAQINEVVHASGILSFCEKWLSKDEEIEYLSLGAGNEKGKFDLITNKRIAEFKFGTSPDGTLKGWRRRTYLANYIALLINNAGRDKYFVLEDKQPFLKFIKGKSNWRKVLNIKPLLVKKFDLWLQNKNLKNIEQVSHIFSEFPNEVIIVDIK